MRYIYEPRSNAMFRVSLSFFGWQLKKGPRFKGERRCRCMPVTCFILFFFKKSTDTSPCTERARVGTSRGERRSWRSRTSNRSVLLCVASKIENKIKIFLETPARKKKRRRRLPRRLSPPSKAIHLVPKIQLTACTLFSFLFGETCVLFSSSNKKSNKKIIIMMKIRRKSLTISRSPTKRCP